jgi:phosphohistidine phosphatase SixA
MIRHALTALLLLLALAAASAADPVVILVRHAERADSGGAAGTMMATDPDLAQAGYARAEALARLLKDAGIAAIYTTEYRRTQQTAAPLARALMLDPQIVPAAAGDDLLRRLAAARDPVLVVGHSNTVPEIIAALGVTEAVAVADDEFDGVFVVFRGANPTLLRLRY